MICVDSYGVTNMLPHRTLWHVFGTKKAILVFVTNIFTAQNLLAFVVKNQLRYM